MAQIGPTCRTFAIGGIVGQPILAYRTAHKDKVAAETAAGIPQRRVQGGAPNEPQRHPRAVGAARAERPAYRRSPDLLRIRHPKADWLSASPQSGFNLDDVVDRCRARKRRRTASRPRTVHAA